MPQVLPSGISVKMAPLACFDAERYPAYQPGREEPCKVPFVRQEVRIALVHGACVGASGQESRRLRDAIPLQGFVWQKYIKMEYSGKPGLDLRKKSYLRISLKKSLNIMKKYICSICQYVYDPAKGDPEGGIAPGTAFEDIPDTWVCPVCGVGKEDFEPYNE